LLSRAGKEEIMLAGQGASHHTPLLGIACFAAAVGWTACGEEPRHRGPSTDRTLLKDGGPAADGAGSVQHDVSVPERGAGTTDSAPSPPTADSKAPKPTADGKVPKPTADGTVPKPTADGKVPKPTGEILLFDGDNRQFTAADKGFHALIKPGDPLPLPNWLVPENYYDGELRIRYVIKAPAGQEAGKLQTCIWTMGSEDGDGKNYFPESCADQVPFSGIGTFYGKALIPSQWWKNSGVPLDFSHPERFLIRVVLRGTSGCNVTSHSVSNACWNEWPKYQNMIFRVTLVMVPAGAVFSGWANYP
jgi:hypothetical protein